MSMFPGRFTLRCWHCGLWRTFRNGKTNEEIDQALRDKEWVVRRNESGDLTGLACPECSSRYFLTGEVAHETDQA